MNNIQRKAQLGLVAIFTATAMLVPSSFAATQTQLRTNTIEAEEVPKMVCIRVPNGWICYIPDKAER
jgi:hypothetical protein